MIYGYLVTLSREFLVQSRIPIQLNLAISRIHQCSMHRNPRTCQLKNRKWPRAIWSNPRLHTLRATPKVLGVHRISSHSVIDLWFWCRILWCCVLCFILLSCPACCVMSYLKRKKNVQEYVQENRGRATFPCKSITCCCAQHVLPVVF